MGWKTSSWPLVGIKDPAVLINENYFNLKCFGQIRVSVITSCAGWAVVFPTPTWCFCTTTVNVAAALVYSRVLVGFIGRVSSCVRWEVLRTKLITESQLATLRIFEWFFFFKRYESLTWVSQKSVFFFCKPSGMGVIPAYVLLTNHFTVKQPCAKIHWLLCFSFAHSLITHLDLHSRGRRKLEVDSQRYFVQFCMLILDFFSSGWPNYVPLYLSSLREHCSIEYALYSFPRQLIYGSLLLCGYSPVKETQLNCNYSVYRCRCKGNLSLQMSTWEEP